MLPIEEWFRKPINRTEKKVNVNARSHSAAVHEVKPSAVKTAKPIETKEPLQDESIQDIQQIKVIQDTEEIRPRENEENIVTEESEAFCRYGSIIVSDAAHEREIFSMRVAWQGAESE